MTTPVEQAAEILRQGGLVAIPTETVYGLAADAQNEWAVRQIFAVKGRPSTHPLIVHLPSIEALPAWVAFVPREAQLLAEAFWPGPLTLILKRSSLPSDVVTGGQDTVGVRVPNHPLTQELLTLLGGGLAAPSANRFGGVSPTTAQHVREDLGPNAPFILDGGPCQVGVESTIIDLSRNRPVLLRPGGISREAVEAVLHRPVEVDTHSQQVRASGTLASHYAPRAGLLLVEEDEVETRARALQEEGKKVAVWTPSPRTLPEGIVQVRLSTDEQQLAQALYAQLRAFDALGIDVIVTTLPKATGLQWAVRDRLTRAAAPRSQ